MGIDLFWDDDEQTTFLVEFRGDWTWDELNAVIKTTNRLSQERQQVLGAILDLREGLRIPGGSIFNREGLNQFRELISMSNSGQENGPVVIVGMSGMIKTVFDAVTKLDRDATQSIYFAATMDEACDVMQAKLEKQQSSPRA
jgi:hypothetical protein